MAVAENGIASSENHFETTDLQRSNAKTTQNDVVFDGDQNIINNNIKDTNNNNTNDNNNNNNVNDNIDDNIDDHDVVVVVSNGGSENGEILKSKSNCNSNSNGDSDNGYVDQGFKKEIRELQEMLSKLNPMAKEFVPPSMVVNQPNFNGNFGYVSNFLIQSNFGAPNVDGHANRRRRNGFGQGKRRMNNRTSMAQRDDVIRRTVYVSDIDQQVTEEQLASLFINCGPVVDCRVCGDPNSVLRFAFVEFTDEESANAALSLSGTMLGFYPVKVLPSKTAIAPVNPTFLPKSENEREMCARTVYCTNIDKKVTQSDIKLFFETFCGEVQRLRLLGDYHHSTRIAFVEFVMAESAISALNCSGALLGSLPIRVSPSKTPVRPRPPRSPLH